MTPALRKGPAAAETRLSFCKTRFYMGLYQKKRPAHSFYDDLIDEQFMEAIIDNTPEHTFTPAFEDFVHNAFRFWRKYREKLHLQ
uniref:Uncharacterized protein n=1 Tax=Sphaerodactylus townsendi TaxID=933632 RepID=A0ACB8EPD3_9SAUR